MVLKVGHRISRQAVDTVWIEGTVTASVFNRAHWAYETMQQLTQETP